MTARVLLAAPSAVARVCDRTASSPSEPNRRAPLALTRSMSSAKADLKLDALYVVYPGGRRYPLADRIEAVPLAHFVSAA